MEVEAKFIIPDRNTMDRLKRAVRLGPFRPGPLSTRHVRDEYLDTATRDLNGQRYACRVREQSGNRVLTLKDLGQAESAIHERTEREFVLPEETDAVTSDILPDLDTWNEARAIIGSQPLSPLFTVDQVRCVRELRQRGRLVAELSIDEVQIQAGEHSQSLWLLEAELCADGTRDDLVVLAEHLQDTWGLRADLYSKYHRGLALLDQPNAEADVQTDGLSAAERAQLEQIVEQAESERVRKRAQLILGWDEKASVRKLASDIGGSRSWAYGWLARFRAERMSIFAEALTATQDEGPTLQLVPIPAEIHTETPSERPMGMSVGDMLDRFQVDVARARRVADHALVLFDATAGIHKLGRERRRVLEVMGLLHNVGLEMDPDRHHITGRDIVLDHPLAELSGIEQRMLAAAIYLHRKRIKRKRLRTEVVTSLPRGVREDTLTLAALLRVADGLNGAPEQSSELQQIRVMPAAVHVSVSGPFAEADAAAAQTKADLWEHLFDVPFFISAPDAGAKPLQVAESLPPSASAPVPDAQSLKSPGLLPDDLMGEAGRKVLCFHFLRMLEHEPGTRLGQDIEELHDMRVATRRMRSAFRVFGPHLKSSAIRPYVVGLRRTARALGAVRDLDVLMDKAKAYLADLPQEREHDLDPLLSLWRKQREAARKEMVAHLDSAKYRDFCEGFRLFLETPGVGLRKRRQFPPEPAEARYVVPILIYTRWANVQAFGDTLDGASISTLHALRIECKRLRYTLEFFREVLGSQVRQAIAEVVRLQDHLGDLNDADVANTQLSDFLFAASRGNARDAPKPVIAPGVVAYLATKQRELQNLVLTFPDAWAQFNRPEVRRWLADAVAVL